MNLIGRRLLQRLGLGLLVVTTALGPMPAAEAGSGSAGASVEVGHGSGGGIVQVIDIDTPERITLGFRWCDGFTCGDAAPECYSNKWIPGFTAPEVVLAVPPPGPGETGFDGLQGLIVQQVDDAGTVTATMLQAAAKQQLEIIRTLDTLQIELNQSSKAIIKNLRAHVDDSGRQCGFTDDEKRQFETTVGHEIDNSANRHLRVTLVWKAPGPDGALPPVQARLGPTVLNGGHESDAVALLAPARAGLEPARYAGFRQDQGAWAKTTVAGAPFERAGTVPTTVANLLSAFASGDTPDAVAGQLTQRGVLQPGGAAAWDGLRDYLGSRQLQPAETTVPAALDRLASAGTSAGSILAAYTVADGGRSQETLVLLTGYDRGRDRLTVLDPARGERTMSTEQLAAGNPYLMQVVAQRQQQALDSATAVLRAQSDAALSTIRGIR